MKNIPVYFGNDPIDKVEFKRSNDTEVEFVPITKVSTNYGYIGYIDVGGTVTYPGNSHTTCTVLKDDGTVVEYDNEPVDYTVTEHDLAITFNGHA